LKSQIKLPFEKDCVTKLNDDEVHVFNQSVYIDAVVLLVIVIATVCRFQSFITLLYILVEVTHQSTKEILLVLFGEFIAI
jgi:hypothetical protein